MPFGVTAAIAEGLGAVGIGTATAGILADGIVGAGVGGLLGSVTGSGFGKGALLGGLGGVGGGLFANLAPETAASLGIGGASGAAGSGANNVGTAIGADGLPTSSAISNLGSNIGTNSATLGTAGSSVGATTSAAGSAGANTGFFSKLGGAISDNPLKALQIALAAKQAFGAPQVNVGQNASNVFGTNPGFNAALPKYTMSQNTAAPYAGNWYTYGQTPQTPLYNSTLIPPVTQARGGLIQGYAHGGSVRKYAMGGMPPMAGDSPSMMTPPQDPRNPLATQNGFAIGKALGQQLQSSGTLNHIKSPKDAHRIGSAIGAHLASKTFTGEGQVSGQGTGQSDSVPARLSVDEFVIPADVTAHLGDGSSTAGGKALDHFVKNVRAHKAVKGFPPKARNPLSYLPKGAM